MDIVVGNPPWDIWKANSDDFFSEYDNDFRGLPNKRVKTERMKELFTNLSGLKDKWDAEQQRFKDGSKYFRSDNTYKYQRWTVNGRKTSSDLNLYKISVERFAQLASSSARFSILVPDNFATDNGPTGIRHLVLDNYHLEEFLSFENRKSIFPAIDNRYKFAVLTFNYGDAEIDSFKAFFYRHSLDDLSNEEVKLNYPVDFIKQTEPERYAFVEARTPELFDLFKKIRTRFPDLNHTRLLKFSRDFDANKESSKFIYKNDGESLISIYEGKTFNQFTIEPQKIKHYVTAEKMENKDNEDYKFPRLAFRGIASSTNKRSLIATLLPKNSSGTYSVWIQRNCEQTDIIHQLFYLSFYNSYTLDFVIRQLVTININLPFSMQLPVPKYEDIPDAQKLIQIVKAVLKENKGYYTDLDKLIPGDEYADKTHDALIAELNARVMLDFDLTRDEVLTLMHTFESAKWKDFVEEETQRIVDVYDQLSAARK